MRSGVSAWWFRAQGGGGLGGGQGSTQSKGGLGHTWTALWGCQTKPEDNEAREERRKRSAAREGRWRRGAGATGMGTSSARHRRRRSPPPSSACCAPPAISPPVPSSALSLDTVSPILSSSSFPCLVSIRPGCARRVTAIVSPGHLLAALYESFFLFSCGKKRNRIVRDGVTCMSLSDQREMQLL
uniref:Uncharacterized protein n=1 Tax=Arundo donax TaxID=35708 RepID=A0A0A9D694_ARUDO